MQPSQMADRDNALDRRDDRWLARTAIAGLVLHAIPLGGLWLDVIITPPAAPRSRTAYDSAGVGVIASASVYRNSRTRQELRPPILRKRLRAEARVITNAHALAAASSCLQHIVRNSLGRDAHIRKGKVIRDDAAPAIRSKLDYAHPLHPPKAVILAKPGSPICLPVSRTLFTPCL